MTEKWLQYLWNYKLFNRFDFKDTQGLDIEVLHFGTWNTNAGPDFLMGKIKLQNIILVGNIELHLKSSDWIFHQHSEDSAYENVILHVVYQHDVSIDFLTERNIPTLELKNYIDPAFIQKYESLTSHHVFIPCEAIFNAHKIPIGSTQEWILQKLDEKSLEIEQQLLRFKNNYEAVLFHRLAYAFGLKINAEIFQQLAERIDFGMLNKIRQNPIQLEAFFLGKAGWLNDPEDEQTQLWAKEYQYVSNKYQCPQWEIRPKLLRLRPPNFPTLRLSQLANLYHQQSHLFSKIIEAKSIEDLYSIFRGITASKYWDNHYNFGKISEQSHPKVLSSDFIERVIINAVLPLKYTYYKNYKEEIIDEVLDFYIALGAEKNQIISSWEQLGVRITNALESQSFLYLYKKFCLQKKCLNCSVAYQLFKSK